jgi:hypothetical protein
MDEFRSDRHELIEADIRLRDLWSLGSIAVLKSRETLAGTLPSVLPRGRAERQCTLTVSTIPCASWLPTGHHTL